ncbi:hypothetical protein BT96DRAFT_924473 [Gymnopus androsaceus JB14]|uniref:Uncharacterized protein n=1 Tax=Gymnopus androsaceus JB14 TaxID=1447944 RepID=A0A6A4H517_9AGAR|nr:hypothetical protein BT96DRAFT_924473 [Gymnopus androsaceus JB14]
MDAVIQYTTFTATDAFVKDHHIVTDGLEMLKTAEGHVSSYWGVQVPEEGSKRGYLCMAVLKKVVAGDLVRHQFSHVVGASPVAGMEANVTEFVYITPKEGVSDSAIKEAAEKLDDVFNANGHVAALGESVEGHGVYLIIVGWPSNLFVSPIVAFKAVANLEVTHAVLDEHN